MTSSGLSLRFPNDDASNDTVTTLVADWQGTTHHQITNSSGP